MNSFDQRGDARIRYTVKTCLTWAEGRVHGYSLDISASGIFVETSTLLPLDTDVLVQFELGSETNTPRKVVARGTVARTISSVDSDPGGTFLGMGVVFDSLKEGELSLHSLVGDGTPLDQRQPPPRRADGNPSLSMEQRRAARVPVGIPVWWGDADPPASKGHLANISETGALALYAGEVMPLGSRIFVGFKVPVDGRVVEVRGIARVVRAVPQADAEVHGMGLEFEANTMDIQTLSRFIEGRLQQSDEIVQLEDVVDDSWRLDWGQVSRRFMVKATAALFTGTVGIHLLFKVLYAIT